MSPAISPASQDQVARDTELSAVRLHRGGRLRGSGARRNSLGRDRRRGRARRDRHHRRPRRGRRRRPGRHPPAMPARRQVRGLGRGPAFPPAAPRDVLHLRGAGGDHCGDGSKCVFVSSTLHAGNLGGLTGGDAICNARAAAAGLPGAYEAWLSIGGTGNSAAERLTQAAVPYKLVDGSTVANDFADLTTCDGSGGTCLQHPIDLTETGAGPVDAEVWTATGVTGMREGGDCGGWDMSDEEDVLGSFGLSSAVDASWTLVSDGEAPCSEDRRLYCFQQ